MQYHIGEIVSGTVTGIQAYGAFVQLDNETQGLVHISECRSAYIQSVDDELQVGMKVRVMIMDIDEYSGKISLSRRSVEDLALEALAGKPHFSRGRVHYWTSQHYDFGFQTIQDNKADMVSEALQRLDKSGR